MDLCYITDLEIDYLTKLDYQTLKRLCCVNKQFSLLLTNKRLRTLLLRNDKIKLPLDFNIVTALNELYFLVIKLVNNNHPIIPIWVNKSLFIIERIEEMYNFIFTGLLNCLEYWGFNQSTFDNSLFFDISVSNIHIHGNWRPDDDQLLQRIQLPDKFKQYISYSLLNWQHDKGPEATWTKECKQTLINLLYDLFWSRKFPNEDNYYITFRENN